MKEQLSAGDLIDIEAVKAKLHRAQQAGTRLGEIWTAIERAAKNAPREHAWFVPFVAAVTGDQRLHQEAKGIILAYLDALDNGELSMGMQFHFWCFALPHARWAIWFDLLSGSGAWSQAEIEQTAARFLLAEHRDFYSGLWTKPYPEIADNQTGSLCLSCMVLGTMMARHGRGGKLAEMFRQEGFRRAEAMIGAMPVSGYGGEGSAYQAGVVSFAVPFFVEFMELAHGGNWFDRPMAPNGTTAKDVLQMTVRLWQPSGLLLPWDDYGYMLGGKSPIAYLAKRTGESGYVTLLEQAANWAAVFGAGWGFDDPIWAMIHWPEKTAASKSEGASWAHDELGGALVSPSGDRYLMQMWDPTSEPPIRAHTNPNSLVLEADAVPLTVDGSCTEQCTTFNYEDTFIVRAGMDFHNARKVYYGRGTAGAHNALLVDGWESFRPKAPWQESSLAEFDAGAAVLAGDVTGLYRSRYPDARKVVRKSRLVEGRFWLVEDLAEFDKEHDITSRWYFRPGVVVAPGGIDLLTPEGEQLAMRALAGDGQGTVTRIAGYPAVLDGQSDRVDFHAKGKSLRWLWLLWPCATRETFRVIDRGWRAWPGEEKDGPQTLAAAPAAGTLEIPPTGQPWLHAEVPLKSSWWYSQRIATPAKGPWWLGLPRGLPAGTQLWLDGREIDLSSRWPLADLMAANIEAPADLAAKGEVTVTLHMNFNIGHYPAKRVSPGETAPDGQVKILRPIAHPATLAEASYRNGLVTVASADGKTYKVRHDLMNPVAGDRRSK